MYYSSRVSRTIPCCIGALVLFIATAAVADRLTFDEALDSITGDSIARHIEILASDNFEGRAPSTAGEEKSIAYIRDRFQESGLETMPGGDWFQKVPIVGKTLIGEPKIQLAGSGLDRVLKLGEDTTIGSDYAVDAVSFTDLEVVFVGHGIVAPEYGWNDYEDLDVAGKVVMVLMADPGRLSEDEDFFHGKALTNYGTSNSKGEEAAKRGALGFIVIHDMDIVGYPWAPIQNGVRNQKFSGIRAASDPAKPRFGMYMRRETANEMLTAGGHSYEEVATAAGQANFRGFELGLTMSVDFKIELAHSISHNVIGVLPGSERSDEYLLYTAHWDHLGVGAEVDGDSIYNGAVDNATGTGVLLELARAFATLEKRPARSIVFIATAAEEQGLLGAYHYASHPAYPLADTAGVINMDGLFPFGEFNSMTVVAMGSSELEDYLAIAARAEGRGLEADPAPEQGAFFRSDHYPFAKIGVPALFAVGGPASDPEPSAEIIERFTKYMQSGYHKAADEYDAASWDMRGITGDARIFFRTGVSIANDLRMPNWYFDSEFRALRDQQLRARGNGISRAQDSGQRSAP
jgi:Zn-dependent M28 family amino/carboxypeptidase